MAILFCFGQGQTIEAQNSPGLPPGEAPPISDATPSVTPTATAPVAVPQVSPRVAEIAKLVQSGVSEEVLIAFIKNSPQAFSPSADEILYLTDLGMPDSVLTVMMQHQPVAPVMMAPPVAVAPPAPAPVIVTTNIIVNTETRYVQAAPATVTTFYEPLRPYGSWVEVDDYGLCWQPTVVVNNRDWRPYSDRGRWVYTYSGWYWQSDYSWGWAPFHYGRWHSSPHYGWVWTPDRVWAPAWVSWRYNDDYCGWAPLPPAARFDFHSGFSFGSAHVGLSFDFGLRPDHYNFVPTSHFHDRWPNRYVVRGDNVRNVYNTTTVINNYSVKNNTTVINEGVGRDRIAAATHTRIEPVILRQTASVFGTPRREVLDKRNNTLLVYQPAAASTASNTRSSATVNGSRAGRQEMIKLEAPIQKGNSPVRPNAVRERPEMARAERSPQMKNGEIDRQPETGQPFNQGRSYSAPGKASARINSNSAPLNPRTSVFENTTTPTPVKPTPRSVEKVEKVERQVPPTVRNYPGADIGRVPIGNRSPESSRMQVAEAGPQRVPTRTERPAMAPAPEVRKSPEPTRAPTVPSYSTPPARTEPSYRPPSAPSIPPSQPVYRPEPSPSHGGQLQSAPAYRAPAYQPPAPVQPQRQAPVYSAPSQSSNQGSRGDVPPNYRPDNGGRKFRNDQ